MTYALQGVPHIVIYCDDLFIHTKDIATHYKTIDLMLYRLRIHGFKITPRKCKFLFSSLPFLGYEITPTGVRPEIAKLLHLKKM